MQNVFHLFLWPLSRAWLDYWAVFVSTMCNAKITSYRLLVRSGPVSFTQLTYKEPFIKNAKQLVRPGYLENGSLLENCNEFENGWATRSANALCLVGTRVGCHNPSRCLRRDSHQPTSFARYIFVCFSSSPPSSPILSIGEHRTVSCFTIICIHHPLSIPYSFFIISVINPLWRMCSKGDKATMEEVPSQLIVCLPGYVMTSLASWLAPLKWSCPPD